MINGYFIIYYLLHCLSFIYFNNFYINIIYVKIVYMCIKIFFFYLIYILLIFDKMVSYVNFFFIF